MKLVVDNPAPDGDRALAALREAYETALARALAGDLEGAKNAPAAMSAYLEAMRARFGDRHVVVQALLNRLSNEAAELEEKWAAWHKAKEQLDAVSASIASLEAAQRTLNGEAPCSQGQSGDSVSPTRALHSENSADE